MLPLNAHLLAAARRRLRWAATLLAATAIGSATWWFWPRRLPPPDAEPLTLVRFVATDTFASLPEHRKHPYVQTLEKNVPALIEAYMAGKISPAERDKAMQNVGSIWMTRRLDEYWVLSPDQRTAYLDKIIDEQERWRPRWLTWIARAATQPANRPAETFDPIRLKQRIESLPPHRRAQAAEMARDMRQRRVARGLPAEPGGGLRR